MIKYPCTNSLPLSTVLAAIGLQPRCVHRTDSQRQELPTQGHRFTPYALVDVVSLSIPTMAESALDPI